MIFTKSQFSFDSEEWVLLGNALNEVLNGFEVSEFEQTIGATKSEVESLLQKLHQLSKVDEVQLDLMQARAARNALCETIRKLGVEEFEIRTGYEFARGRAILDGIDSAL
jgi:hypothetical protein